MNQPPFRPLVVTSVGLLVIVQLTIQSVPIPGDAPNVPRPSGSPGTTERARSLVRSPAREYVCSETGVPVPSDSAWSSARTSQPCLLPRAPAAWSPSGTTMPGSVPSANTYPSATSGDTGEVGSAPPTMVRLLLPHRTSHRLFSLEVLLVGTAHPKTVHPKTVHHPIAGWAKTILIHSTLSRLLRCPQPAVAPSTPRVAGANLTSFASCVSAPTGPGILQLRPPSSWKPSGLLSFTLEQAAILRTRRNGQF